MKKLLILALLLPMVASAQVVSECHATTPIEQQGDNYRTGDGVRQNYKKALRCYKQSDSPYAQYQIAMLYLNEEVSGHESQGWVYLNDAAKKGCSSALLTLGRCYEMGLHTRQDYKAAADTYLLLADEVADADALFSLGTLYERGLGVPLDTAEALRYYYRALAVGSADAMCYLGDYHRAGKQLPLSPQKAFNYYQLASQMSGRDAIGLYYVGRSYLEGCGVQRDTIAAMAYLEKAAVRGIEQAAVRLADLYFKGEGVEQDYAAARRFYTIAAMQGNRYSCSQLATIYEKGLGVEPSAKKAKQWREK